MPANTVTTPDGKKLRRWLILFFLALAIPTIILVQQSFSRLKWETFHQHQSMAEELAGRIDSQIFALIQIEEQRPFTDYSFLNVAGETTANFVQRSPLSRYPVESAIPGVIGYFQVDASGNLMTPLLPEAIESAGDFGISKTEFDSRIALLDRIQLILSQNRLVQERKQGSTMHQAKDTAESMVEEESVLPSIQSALNDDMDSAMQGSGAKSYARKPAMSIQGQSAFDELKTKSPAEKAARKTDLGRLVDLRLTKRYLEKESDVTLYDKNRQSKQKVQRSLRTEQSVLPESVIVSKTKREIAKPDSPLPAETEISSTLRPLRISTFESAIDSFEFSQLDKGNFVLFRKVWRNNQRYIQGLLIEQQAFLDAMVNKVFVETALSQMSDLLVVNQGDVLTAFSGRTSRGYLSSSRELNGELLYQTRLSAPLTDMQLLFSITQLPAGPGGRVILWLTLILGFVLCAGFYLMYRLGLGQIRLASQQQDFVSAVSHELKTPLTSIRMYGEMLREGWASEEKKKTYYNFIVDESERLSRLINNVLLMAKLTRNRQQAELKSQSVSGLMENVESTLSSQITAAGFELSIHCDPTLQQSSIKIDSDWFTQIMINLVDNAIKFSATADKKVVDINCVELTGGRIQFSVRDYGPGIQREQMKKVFKLFYRSENELTRETVGTGIGLALVHQMVIGMNGKIDVVNTGPGVEFRLSFEAESSTG